MSSAEADEGQQPLLGRPKTDPPPPPKTVTYRLLGRFMVGCLAILLCGVTTPGYQALLPVLKSEGAYVHLCPSGVSPPATCRAQELRLTLMFTLGLVAMNGSSVVWGFAVEVLRPALAGAIGMLLAAAGFAFLAASSQAVSLWIPGFICLGLCSAAIVFPVFAIVAEFPDRFQSAALASVVGCIDGSSVVFLGVQFLYSHGGLSFRLIMLLLLGATLLLTPLLVLSLRKKAQPASAQGDEPDSTAARGDAECTDADAEAEADAEAADTGPLFRSRMSQMVLTPFFFVLVVWMCAYTVAKYFYMATLHKQLLWISGGDDDFATKYSLVFSFLLPLAIVFMPITGYISSKSIASGLGVLSCATAVLAFFSVAKFLPNEVQLVSLVLLVFSRFYFFAIAPDVIAKVYGTRRQTALYGIGLSAAAAFTNTNYLWAWIAEDKLDDNFLPLNLALLGLASVFGAVMSGLVKSAMATKPAATSKAAKAPPSLYGSLN